MEYREIFLTLLRKYDETKQPQSYLQDLVESTHLFLRMLERFCSGRKNLMVQVGHCVKCVKKNVFLCFNYTQSVSTVKHQTFLYEKTWFLLHFTSI